MKVLQFGFVELANEYFIGLLAGAGCGELDARDDLEVPFNDYGADEDSQYLARFHLLKESVPLHQGALRRRSFLQRVGLWVEDKEIEVWAGIQGQSLDVSLACSNVDKSL